ncbi:PAS domain-containing sensor histidine kinase [Heliophilum fasciatum]|uniref:histidine kinase n=1 Tax=Heliophilum fasciatum TaxID=35700 RepID=A0A4V2SY28_9FIRM|nr:ATP-binding protein [Heliophilum fasciatum]MCW2276988.1 PAS domain S-box-containing protein [Heliophilum fasciatum]TCP68486.1 PAS domain S-box-containing protein [Heliophilum fasciatum]
MNSSVKHSPSSSGEIRLKRIIDHTPVGVCVTDEKGFFRSVNPAYCRIYGYSPEELIGQHFTVVVPPESRQLLCDLHERFMHYGSEIRGEWTVMSKSGKQLTVLAEAALIHDVDGQPQKATFVLDISDRKQMEQALQTAKEDAERANRFKSEFLSHMNHELRTPLNAILGYTQLLDSTLDVPPASEEQRLFTQHILKSSWHLLSLIDDILDLARIEAGKLPIQLTHIPLESLLNEVLSMLAAQPNSHNVDVQLIPPGPDQQVFADMTRLKQVLVNLGSNAIKYNRPGGTVTLRCERPDPTLVRILVEDTGPGIDPAQMPNLFRPFERLGAEKTTIPGSGLGLSITQKLVHLMNGSIGVDSRLGKGSVFSIDLPVTGAP